MFDSPVKGCKWVKIDLFESSSEVVAERSVDERVETAVDEAGPVRGQHGEEELRLVQEADGL